MVLSSPVWGTDDGIRLGTTTGSCVGRFIPDDDRSIDDNLGVRVEDLSAKRCTSLGVQTDHCESDTQTEADGRHTSPAAERT